VEKQRSGYRGYVTSRPFGGYSIPVPVQSLVLRDYCQRKALTFVLPANENIFPHSYLVLEGMIRDLRGFEGIVMCSMHMLPQRAARRRVVFDTVLRQGCSMHFVLENLVVANCAEVDQIEALVQFAQIASRAPAPDQAFA